MSYRLEFHEAVERDYLDAYSWYEDAQKGLGDRFLKMVRFKLEEVVSNPEAFSEKTKSGYRGAVVDVFPYIIVYKIYKKKKVILVNAVVHTKKHPRSRHRR